MNKKYLYLFLTLFVIVVFYFKEKIIAETISIFNNTKEKIDSHINKIELKIEKHFKQAEQIEELKKENQKYKNYIASIQPILNEYQELKKFRKIESPKIIFTQTISYANLPDISTIYINYFESNLSTPRGLIFNNYSAGIVVKNIKNFSIAYLNNNPNTSYTIFIGKEKIPGVLFGGKTITIKYIPKYKKIKIGDIVTTSGLDKIFYSGVKVGRIISIKQKKLYQEAIIQPFYNSLHPTFFYVVKNK